MPDALRALNGTRTGGGRSASAGGGGFDSLRVWTTQLCVAALMALDESWLMFDDADDPSMGTPTIVDVGQRWLAAQARAAPQQTAAAMERSMRAAEETVKLWEYQQARGESNTSPASHTPVRP